MATNLTVNFIGKNQLSKTTAVASRDLKKLGQTAKNVGNTINRSLGAVGIGVGLAALTNGLKNATKAASEDFKSQGLLATALRNTVKATDTAIAGAEQYIKSTQLQTAVLDDELRPALATAVRATGSLAKGQDLLDVALDVSAGTGKDLNTVTNAMAKAFNGSTGSLKKLLPSIKDGEDFMSQLREQFKGSAEEAANLDPYKRLEVIFADIQETVGTALLPSLEKFSDYLASPAGQKNVQEIVDGFVSMGKAIGAVIDFLVKNADAVKAVISSVVFLKVSWAASTTAVKLYTAMTGNAVRATKLLRTALITTGVGAALVLLGQLAQGWLDAGEAKDEYFVDPTAASGDFTISDWAKKNKDKLIPDWSDEWLQLGYDSYGAYLQAMYEADQKSQAKKRKIKAKIADFAKEVRTALDSEMAKIKGTAENFRNSIAIAFGLEGENEDAVFNVDKLLAKLRKVVNASKGFAENIRKLRKRGADESLINEIVGMGPAQGNIAAAGLLNSGKLSQVLGLRAKLYNTGASVASQQALAGNATYEININKSVVSAADIIREIRLLEKKTGRKYLVGS